MSDKISLFKFFKDKEFNTCYFCDEKTKYSIETITLSNYSPKIFNCKIENNKIFCRSKDDKKNLIEIELNDKNETHSIIEYPANSRLFMFFSSCKNYDCCVSSKRASLLNDDVLHNISELIYFKEYGEMGVTILNNFNSTEILSDDNNENFIVDKIPIKYWKDHSASQLKKKIQKLKLLR